MFKKFQVLLITSFLIGALSVLVSAEGYLRSGAEKVASEGRMVANQFRAAYDEDTMGFRSSIEGMGQDITSILMKHLKDFLNAVCQSLGNNPDYKKFSEPFCDSLMKMFDNGTSSSKPPGDPSGASTSPASPGAGGSDPGAQKLSPNSRSLSGEGNAASHSSSPKTK